MTEITKINELNSNIGLALVAAPFVTWLILVVMLCINLCLAAVVEWAITAPDFLVGTTEFFGSAAFLAFFAIPFGIIQFVLIGGWVLRRYLVRRPANPIVVAVLALATNTILSGVLVLLSAAFGLNGLNSVMNLFLLMGSIFAPAWGCVAGFLIHRRQNQRSGCHV
ncbi:hypothetical protein [Falsiruegeria mediterranea]|uniref:Uncharacterized protein n=1 Tax=Falsiruegeria mediterranea M17 TaxID=1200281 RepID=A0A2R8C5Z2_9RHOB|nr:hypothetical protein [Falsiruegeria mediterranea]SPJ27786.1 hypothetical protein TRM7615_01279 [Falsiruegeria mediterranea M17]